MTRAGKPILPVTLSGTTDGCTHLPFLTPRHPARRRPAPSLLRRLGLAALLGIEAVPAHVLHVLGRARSREPILMYLIPHFVL